MNIAPAYRLPLLAALCLHVILFGFFFLHMPATRYRLTKKTGHTIVQASAVKAQDVVKTMHAIEQRQTAQARAAAEHLAALRRAAAQAKHQRALEAEHIRAMHAQQQRIAAQQKKAALALAQMRHKQAVMRAKAKAEAMRQAHLKAVAHQKAVAALHAKQAKLERQLMAKQLAGDAKQVKQLQASQDQGVIDKYKALILSAIGQQWLVPDGVSHQLQSVYEIHLAPGGTVLSVQLIKSSGNVALDQSAKTAILKASPLPVPQSPRQFDNFRDLRLTVSPKAIIHS